MILKANVTEALVSLYGAKQRSILALIGIVIGIASVIAMVSVGLIFQQETMKHFRELGTEVISLSTQSTGASGYGRESLSLTNSLLLPTRVPEILRVAPYVTGMSDAIIEGKKFSAPCLGVTEEFKSLTKLTVLQGRFISDLDEASYFCVLGANFVRKLAEAGITEPLGKSILFKDRVFTVIGLLAEVPQGLFRPYEINEGLTLPFQLALRITAESGARTVLARLRSEMDWRAAEQGVNAFLVENDLKIQVKVQSAEEIIAQMKKQMEMFTMLLAAIGSISLIVGGVGVMNVMLVSVTERKTEIGIRRAIGAQQSDVQTQFIIESLTLCCIGGLIGVLVGIGASYLLARFNAWDFFISWRAVGVGAGVSTLTGLFFGYYPARQAAKLNPIEALKG